MSKETKNSASLPAVPFLEDVENIGTNLEDEENISVNVSSTYPTSFENESDLQFVGADKKPSSQFDSENTVMMSDFSSVDGDKIENSKISYMQSSASEPARLEHSLNQPDLGETDATVDHLYTEQESNLSQTRGDNFILTEQQQKFSLSDEDSVSSTKPQKVKHLQQQYHFKKEEGHQDSNYHQDEEAHIDSRYQYGDRYYYDDLNDPDDAQSYLLDSQQEYFRDPMVDYYDTQLYKEDIKSGYFSKSQSMEEKYYNDFHRRHPLNFDKEIEEYNTEKGDHSSDEEQPPKEFVDKELIDPGPFSHNRKVCIPAIPCAAVILFLVGEWLTGIVVMGYLLVAVLRLMGEDRRCVMVILMIFFPTQIFITYCVFPLIWFSFTNIIIVGVINIYAILTGAWFIVQFSSFRKEENFLCKLIEKLLFGIYPTACAWILSWTISQFVPSIHFPSILLFTWFLFLQIFLIPVPSSFIINPSETDKFNVIEPEESGAIAVIFLIIPIFVQLYQGLLTSTFSGVLTFVFVVQLLFITSMSVFLTTLLGIRQFVELAGWSQHIIHKIRWISGLTATFLLYYVFNNIGLSSHYLPWLPVAIVSYSGYGVLIGTKKYRNFAFLGGLCLILLYSLWVYKLPWQINQYVFYYIPVLLLNAFLCVSLIYLSSYGSMELVGALLFPHSILFVLSELFLLYSELYSLPAVMFTSSAVSYLIYRLYVTKKISDKTANLSLSVYVSVVAITTLNYLQETMSSVSFHHYVTMYMMVFCLLKIFLFDDVTDLTLKQSVINCIALAVTVGMNAPLLLFPMCHYLSQMQCATPHIIGLYFMVMGVLVLLESLLLVTDNDDQLLGAGIISAIVGATIAVLQPELDFTRSSLLRWGVVVSMTSFFGVAVSQKVNKFASLCLVSAIISACPSIQITELLFEQTSHILYPVIYVLGVCSCLFIISTTKVKTKVEDKHVIIMVTMTTASSISLIVMETVKPSNTSLSTAWILLCLIHIIIAASLKILSVIKEDEVIPLVDSNDEKVTPMIPVIGNISTIIAYILLCCVTPFTGFLADVWCCGSTVVLLCLQNDRRVLIKLKFANLIAPVVMMSISNLVIMSFIRNIFWRGEGWLAFLGFWELIFMTSSLPMYYTLWGFLWSNDLITDEQLVVFLMPLHAILLLIATSHTCMTFAVIGLISGIWMMVYKLPLIPYKSQSEVSLHVR